MIEARPCPDAASLLDHIDEIVYVVETTCDNQLGGTVRLLNRRVEQILGYAPEEFLADPGLWLSIVHPEDWVKLSEQTRRIYESRRAGVRLYRVRHKSDGRYRWIEDSVTPCVDEAGNLHCVFGVARDITDRLHDQEKMVRLAQAVEQTADSVAIVRRAGVIEYVNPAFERLTGYASAEVVGRTPQVLKSGHHEPGFYERLWKTILAGGVFRDVFVNRRKDGSLYQEEKTITPIRDAGGRILHFVSTGRDVSERRKMEERLIRVERLEAVGRIASSVAHDFNNVLTVVLGYGSQLQSALAKDRELGPRAREVVEAAERASALTRQLLAFGSSQISERCALDPGEVLRRFEGMLRRLIGEPVALELRVAPGMGQVCADRTQIEQIILNLALNARDAMPGGGRLLIEMSAIELDAASQDRPRELAPGRYIALSVTDSGEGMDPDTAARIFEPFFTTKPLGKGTGLGLSTVQSIVQENSGAITVMSRPGAGTTFRVLLPRLEGTACGKAAPEEAGDAPPGTETILLVEDDASVRHVAATILRQLGYTVREARDVASALGRLQEDREREIRLLLTDRVMPGVQVTHLLERFAVDWPDGRILLMTGYGEELVGVRPAAARPWGLLPKPFTPASMARKVREVLDSGREQPAASG